MTQSNQTRRPKLVALHGPAGAGKDTVADYLAREHGFRKVAFADGIYRSVAAVFGVSEGFLRDRIIKVEPSNTLANMHAAEPGYRQWLHLAKEDMFTPRTSRYHLVKYGNEYALRGDSLRWVTEAVSSLTAADTVVSDLRSYRNLREYTALRRWAHANNVEFLVVQITPTADKPPCGPGVHESEIPLPDALIDKHLVNIKGEPGLARALYEVEGLVGLPHLRNPT